MKRPTAASKGFVFWRKICRGVPVFVEDGSCNINQQITGARLRGPFPTRENKVHRNPQRVYSVALWGAKTETQAEMN